MRYSHFKRPCEAKDELQWEDPATVGGVVYVERDGDNYVQHGQLLVMFGRTKRCVLSPL